MLLRTLIIGLLYPFDAETRRNTAHNASGLRPSAYVRKRQRSDPIWTATTAANEEDDDEEEEKVAAVAASPALHAKANAKDDDDHHHLHHLADEVSGAENATGWCACVVVARDDPGGPEESAARVAFRPHADVIGEHGVTVQVLFTGRKKCLQRNPPLDPYQPLTFGGFST
jgi:hypothetical protein